MENIYRRILGYFINHNWISFLIITICFALIYLLSTVLESELAPSEDHSYIGTMITGPEGMEYSTTQRFIDRIAQMSLDSIPETNYILTRYGTGGFNSGVNTGFIINFLSDPTERKLSQKQIHEKLSKMYSTIADARIIATQEPTISTSNSRGLPVQFVLQNLNFDKLRIVLPKFLELALKSPVFSNVDVDLKFNKPELNIIVDRLKANSLGISERAISDALALSYSGSRYGYFLRNNKQYFVVGQVSQKDRSIPANISSMYVRSSSNNMIQLDNLVKIEENSNPPILYHFNRYKSATVSADLADGRTLGEGIEEMERIADKLLDPSFTTALAGQSRDFSESSSNISFALVLALLLIYLILAAQFESFRDPFIIMLTVPMAIAGAMISLWMFNQTLNIFSEIGIILLIGIVTKNGILIVEFANQKRKQGNIKKTAAFEAAVARLRPILMTSLATTFGALPIALALGAGAQSRIPLGIVVVGGIMFSLLLTLFVIPVIYVVMSKKDKNV